MRMASEALDDGSSTSADALDAIRHASMARTTIMDSYGMPSVEMEQNQLTLPLDGATANQMLSFG